MDRELAKNADVVADKNGQNGLACLRCGFVVGAYKGRKSFQRAVRKMANHLFKKHNVDLMDRI